MQQKGVLRSFAIKKEVLVPQKGFGIVACANAAFWFQCSTFVACTIRLAVLVGWGAWRQCSVRSVACTVRFRGAIPAHRVPQHSVPMQVCGSALGRMAAVPRVAIRWRAQGKVCVGPESAAFGFHWRAQRKVCVGLGSAALTRVTVHFKCIVWAKLSLC